MDPREKAKMLASLERPLMIGDGYNDTLAFQKSYLGIGAHGGVESSLKVTDAFFVEEDLLKIKEVFDIARLTNRQVRINLGFALFYNFIAGSLAIFGLINPFVAAILMPLSSLCILGISFYGMRKR